MSELTASADRREQILAEVAEGLHAVFKETQRRTLEAEDNDEFIRLSGSLHKIGRGLRQCVGMHAKLERDRRSDDAKTAAQDAEARADEIEDRKGRISRAVGRRIEAEWPDTGDLDDNEAFNERFATFNERLDDLCEEDDFLDLDPDVLIAQLCEEFGLTIPAPRPFPPVPAKAGTQAGSTPRAGPPDAPRANGHDPHAPPADTS